MVFIPWESECVTLTDPAHPNIPTFPCGIIGVRKLVSTIDGESCFFGYYQWWANAGSGETVDEDQFVLKPVADFGKQCFESIALYRTFSSGTRDKSATVLWAFS